jgi:C-terminal processing protease CtpA/Prc
VSRLEVGDVITAVDEEYIAGKTCEAVVCLITGKPQSQVSLCFVKQKVSLPLFALGWFRGMG